VITSGSQGVATLVVSDRDTAVAVGSGDVPVLATPRIAALAEAAAVAALRPFLGPGETSVGTRIDLEHRAPTAVGATVTARATVTGVEGRGVTFALRVVEGDAVVASGTHVRVVVDREWFLSRLEP